MSGLHRDPDPCPACGTWVCGECLWKRTYANRFVPQTCGACGNSDGTMVEVRHWSKGKAESERLFAQHMIETGRVYAYPPEEGNDG